MPSPELEKGPAYPQLRKAMSVDHRPPWNLPDEASWPKEWGKPDPDVLQELKEQNPTQLLFDLIKFVKKLMGNGPKWVAARYGTSADGTRIKGEGLLDPSEIAIDAIFAALTGEGIRYKRRRRPGQPLRGYIWGIARSFVYHQSRRWRGTPYDEALSDAGTALQTDPPEKPVMSAETLEQISRVLGANSEFVPVVDWLIAKGEESQAHVAARHNMTREQLGKLVWKTTPILRKLLAEFKP